MKRECLPEILDSLPPGHPEAVRNRRDLRVINTVMGNRRWFARSLAQVRRPGERVLEVGAGTGELGIELFRKGQPVDGLDLWPRPKDWPGPCAWHQSDLKAFARYGDYDIVLGNLIFHQFEDADLERLGRVLSPRIRALVACEPLRRRLSQRMMAAFGPLFGASKVTLHDSRVSITAGFVSDELSRAFGMSEDAWNVTFTTSALGAYRMVAVRRTPSP